jgi:hypothetical protein
LPRLEDDIEEPMCLDCADGLACSFKRCAGQGRQESSVAVTAAEVDRLGLIEPVQLPGPTVIEIGDQPAQIETESRDVPRLSRRKQAA